MRYLIPILLAVVVLSSGCDPNDGQYSCDLDGCYEENNAQYLTLEDCLSVCDGSMPGGCGSPVLHEGYLYSTVQIGDQCWFSENCRYLPEISTSNEISQTEPRYYVYGYEGTDVQLATSDSLYDAYGVLFNWPAVMTEDICPSGWHIPSDNEWQDLEISLGMNESVAEELDFRGTNEGFKMKSVSGWYNNGNGSNLSGFNALPGGLLAEISFYGMQLHGFWWSSTVSEDTPMTRQLVFGQDDISRAHETRSVGMSARCLKD